MSNSENAASVQIPFLTVIVPAWNLPPHMLHDCVESILALPLAEEDLQIIVVDDGSDLSALLPIEEWQDRLLYIRQPHRGPSAARNTAFRLAQGEWIQMVDGDDWLFPEQYAHCLELMKNKETDVVYFRLTRSQQPSSQPFQDDAPLTGAYLLNHQSLRVGVGGYAFRRKLLGSLTFREGILHEDEEFTPQLFVRADSIVQTSAQPYFYRRRLNSTMESTDPEVKAKRLLDAEGVVLRLYHKAGTLPTALQTGLERCVAQQTMALLYQHARLGSSWNTFNECVQRLRSNGLFPLPLRPYSKKYQVFAALSRTTLGLWTFYQTFSKLA